jgi:hypothetical protein
VNLLHITPSFPPIVSGLAGYSSYLGRSLFLQHGWSSNYLTLERYSKQEDFFIEGGLVFRVENVNAFNREFRSIASKCDAILLHYVGYGYDKRGAPIWLVNTIEEYYRMGCAKKIVIIFHELFAFGPPWTSSFWLCQTQQWIVKRLAKVASYSALTTHKNWDYMKRILGHKDGQMQLLPVFSTIGEGEIMYATNLREPYLVIFANSNWIKKWFLTHGQKIESICRMLDINEIHVVGCDCVENLNTTVKIRWLGILPNHEVRCILQRAKVAFMDYLPQQLAKSSMFAAFASNGVPVIMPSDNGASIDGLRASYEYMLISDDLRGDLRFNDVANKAKAWYDSHSLSVTSNYIAEALSA